MWQNLTGIKLRNEKSKVLSEYEVRYKDNTFSELEFSAVVYIFIV